MFTSFITFTDVREVNGLRLLLVRISIGYPDLSLFLFIQLIFLKVKNPWSHKRWTGPFSHLDHVNWTPELMKALDYDRESALNDDDGIYKLV